MVSVFTSACNGSPLIYIVRSTVINNGQWKGFITDNCSGLRSAQLVSVWNNRSLGIIFLDGYNEGRRFLGVLTDISKVSCITATKANRFFRVLVLVERIQLSFFIEKLLKLESTTANSIVQ